MVAAGIFVVGYIFFGQSKKPIYDYIVVKRGNITQAVNLTGKVKPAEDADLGFERSGLVNKINVRVGDKVLVGDELIELDNAELIARRAQTEAGVKIQQAKLNELKKGDRPEDVKVQETKVVSSEVALEDAKRALVDKLQDAYTKSDDAIRGKVDQFFINPTTSSAQINFFSVDSQLEIDIEFGRLSIENALKLWKSSIDHLAADSDLNSYVNVGRENLEQIKEFLEKVSLILNNPYNSYIPSIGVGASAIPSIWKSDVSTARTSINTAISNLSTAEKDLRTAESNLTLAEDELILKKAGATIEQIIVQEAQLERARADSDEIQVQIKKTILRAPINGIITRVDAKVGEIVSLNTSIVSLISNSQFEIEVNVPEADIAKLKIGNIAQITLDAYGNDIIFDAKVVTIDPAEKIIEGVATYKTTLWFTQKVEGVKSGMTANINIITDKRENVIVIPQRAIITDKDGGKGVKILTADGVNDVKITTGLRGDAGVEIIEGLNEDDKLVLSSD